MAGRFKVLPIYHPAAAIYDRTKRDDLFADFGLLRELLGEVRGRRDGEARRDAADGARPDQPHVLTREPSHAHAHHHDRERRATQAVGERCRRWSSPGDVLVLSGDLGAGKTQLTKVSRRVSAWPSRSRVRRSTSCWSTRGASRSTTSTSTGSSVPSSSRISTTGARSRPTASRSSSGATASPRRFPRSALVVAHPHHRRRRARARGRTSRRARRGACPGDWARRLSGAAAACASPRRRAP